MTKVYSASKTGKSLTTLPFRLHRSRLKIDLLQEEKKRCWSDSNGISVPKLSTSYYTCVTNQQIHIDKIYFNIIIYDI